MTPRNLIKHLNDIPEEKPLVDSYLEERDGEWITVIDISKKLKRDFLEDE
jgi:hypothetical protein